jgi:ribosome assembly protein YihI (activator of Der GTPase)
MTQEERNIIISVWNDMVLRGRLEDDPYSLSRDELTSLQTNDRLNEHIDSLSTNKVLLNAALKNYISQA